MNVHYCITPAGNFGDDINRFVWPALFGDLLGRRPELTLVGIGTLLDDAVYAANRNAAGFLCLGSGAGYGAPLRDMTSARWIRRVVRGPLSAELLGLPPSEACTDGAMTLALPPLASLTAARPRRGVVFMPHHQAFTWTRWPEVCAEAGVELLDPRGGDPQATLARLASAELVIADAMHAAICADVVRTPWIATRTSEGINSLKWRDWTLSMGVDYAPEALPSRTPLENAMRGVKRALASLRRAGGASQGDGGSGGSGGGAALRLLALEQRLGLTSRVFRTLVAGLRALSGREGGLSTDATFRSRRDQMAEHVEAVRTLLAG